MSRQSNSRREIIKDKLGLACLVLTLIGGLAKLYGAGGVLGWVAFSAGVVGIFLIFVAEPVRQKLQCWRIHRNPAVIVEIDAALAKFHTTYGRKQPQGYAAWVAEDLAGLAASYRDLIERFDFPEGVFRAEARAVETEPDLKHRMLRYYGILGKLRERIGSDSDRPPP